MITRPMLLDETGQKIKLALQRVKNKFLGTATDPVTPGQAGSSGVSPVIQDDTGREIISALNDLADAVKPASATEQGLVSTGDQTFAGAKIFTSSPTVASAGSDANVKVLISSGSASVEYHGYKNNYGGRAYINEASGKSDGTGSTGYYERYFLPPPDADRTSSVDYRILTTKEPVTIAQGGTGQKGQTAQQSYTPTVTIGTTAQTVSSLSAHYKSWGLMKLIGGRFNLTTTGTGSLKISLPTGFTVPTSAVQPMGILIAPDQKAYHIRVTSDGLSAMSNGGSNVSWTAGYYCFWAVVMGN